MPIGDGFQVPRFGEQIESNIGEGFASSGGSESGKLFGIKFAGTEERPAELPFWRDKATMARFPNLYGLAGSVTRTFIDAIPYAKYGLSEERKHFMSLPKEQQHAALVYDMLETELFVAAPAIFKGVGKLAKKAMRRTVKAKAIRPVEDLIGNIKGAEGGVWESFSYQKAATEALTSKNVTKEQASVLIDAVRSGDNKLLTRFHREQVLRKEKTAVTAFEKKVEWDFLKGTKPSQALVDELDYGKLQAKHWRKLYRDNMEAAKFSPMHSEAIFKEQATQFFDKEAMKSISWETITEEQAANMITQMFYDPVPLRKMFTLGAGKVHFPMIQPQRVLAGAGESLYGIKSRIYDKLVGSTGVSNLYKLDLQHEAASMLQQRGFGELVSKGVGKKFKPNKKILTDDLVKEVDDMVRKVDDLSHQAMREKDTAKVLELRKEINGLLGPMNKKGGAKAQLFNWHRDVMDKLYEDAMRRKIPILFKEAGVNATGLRQIEGFMKKLEPKLQKHFSTEGARPYEEQLAFVEETFKTLRRFVGTPKDKGGHYWFDATGKELTVALKSLNKELTVGTKGGWPGFFENYAARVESKGVQMDEAISTSLRSDMAGFWTEQRTAVKARASDVGLFGRVEARINAQAKDLYLYPEINKVGAYAKTLPQAWRNYTDHLIARMLNRPSNIDNWVARSLENTLGAGKRAWTGDPTEGLWNARRVQQLAQNINNFTYMGFLGLKPFAAMRNLFQPLVTGPTDLGRISNIGTIIRGYVKAMDPKVRAEVKAMGAITDFVPEMSHSPVFQRPGIGGAIDEVKDFCMWMFRMSDRGNRYTMGGAAMIQWDKGIAKYGAPTPKNLEAFFSKTGISKRNPWIIAEIEDTILKGYIKGAGTSQGAIADARKIFIKDVIADTQYLYGSLEAPTLAGMGGATGRTAMTFQSWWMNYGAAMDKWFRTAKGPGGKTERLVTFMLSSAIAEQSMEAMWGRPTALRQIGFGPLPMEGPGMPPAFAMVFDTMKVLKSSAAIPFGGDVQKAEQDLIRAVKSSGNFLPGGNQLRASIKAFQEDGGRGLAESTFMMHKKKEPSAVEKFFGRKGLR